MTSYKPQRARGVSPRPVKLIAAGSITVALFATAFFGCGGSMDTHGSPVPKELKITVMREVDARGVERLRLRYPSGSSLVLDKLIKKSLPGTPRSPVADCGSRSGLRLAVWRGDCCASGWRDDCS